MQDWEESGVTLETERLLLREFVKSDCAAMLAYAGDPETVEYMALEPGDVKPLLAGAIKGQKANPRTQFFLAAVLKATGEIIGSGCINQYKDRYRRKYTEGEVSWILRRERWRQGLGTELAAELLRFGFDELKLHRIAAYCDTGNIGSWRVMERCGMRREGTLRGAVWDEAEQWRDQYVYAILAEEWWDSMKITL